MLGAAEPPLHAERGAGQEHRIRGIRAGGAGTGDQVAEEIEVVHLRAPYAANRSAIAGSPGT